MPTPVTVAKAVNDLRRAESGATSDDEPNFNYTGSGKNSSDSGDNNLNVKGWFTKKRIAAIFVSFLLGGGIFFLGSSNSLLPPALNNLLTEAFDTQYASANVRSSNLMKTLISATDDTKRNWKGDKVYTRMSRSYKKRLAASGIEVKGSGSNRYLEYTPKGSTESKIITAQDLLDTIATDVEFRDAYTKAKRGRIATFFDNTAEKVFGKWDVTRNIWKFFHSTNDADTNEAEFKKTMTSEFDGKVTLTTADRETKQNDDGEEYYDYNPKKDVQDNTSTDLAEANTKARATLENVADVAGKAGSIACAVMKFSSAVSVMVAGMEILGSIHYFTGLIENISKMQAGDGDASAINEVLNFLTTSETSTMPDYSKIDLTNCLTNPEDGCLTGEETIEEVGTALEAPPLQAILSGKAPSSSSASRYSLERVIKVFGGAVTTTTMAYETCLAVDVTDSVFSLAMVALSFTPAAPISISALAIKWIIGTAISFSASFLIQALTPIVAKALFVNAFESATGIEIGHFLAKGGSATGTTLGRNGSSQSLGNKDAAIGYNRLNQEVIAQESELDRLNRSPFDITSKNTFFGNIAYSFLPTSSYTSTTKISSLLHTTQTALASIISNVSADGEGSSYMTVFGDCPTLNSIGAEGDVYCNPITTTDLSTINVIPTATQEDVGSGLISQEDYNLTQEYLDVLMCGPNSSSCDRNKNNENLTCDEDGNCTITSGSNLEKYLAYCSNRTSPFGVVDQNILGNMQLGSSFRNTFVDSAVGSIPVISDVSTLADALYDEKNLVWATGERCVNADNNKEFWESEGRFYQRFLEDSRLLKERGAYDKDEEGISLTDPIEEFETRWEEEHPTDNSYIGQLSRISGLTVENVESTLAMIDYLQYIKEYDPGERIALDDQSEKINQIIIAKQNSIYQSRNIHFIANITQSYIIYSDLRNRTYVV